MMNHSWRSDGHGCILRIGGTIMAKVLPNGDAYVYKDFVVIEETIRIKYSSAEIARADINKTWGLSE